MGKAFADAFGTDLNVGDTVVFARKRSPYNRTVMLSIGNVVKMNEKMLTLKFTRGYMEGEVGNAFARNCVKIGEK